VDKEKAMIDFRPGAGLARIGRLFRPPLSCSFCGRDATQVDRLVAGASAHICDDCITKCLDILERNPREARPSTEADRS
jgi:hypothetical protein